jgi:hypothetical protein
LKEASADSSAPVFSPHEDLPQVNVVSIPSKQGVSDDFPALLDDRGLIFPSEPVRHALCELGNRHRVSMSFIADELRVEYPQSLCILNRRRPKLHCALTVGPMIPVHNLAR